MPKLTIELVPQSCWFSNVRSEVRASVWNDLKRQVSGLAGNRCEVCGGRGPRHPVECHENWRYSDGRLKQTLVGLVALCPDCHRVKHIGRTISVGNGARAIRHLARVNGWSAGKTERYIKSAFEVWEERSQHEWKLSLKGLKRYGVDLNTDLKR